MYVCMYIIYIYIGGGVGTSKNSSKGAKKDDWDETSPKPLKTTAAAAAAAKTSTPAAAQKEVKGATAGGEQAAKDDDWDW